MCIIRTRVYLLSSIKYVSAYFCLIIFKMDCIKLFFSYVLSLLKFCISNLWLNYAAFCSPPASTPSASHVVAMYTVVDLHEDRLGPVSGERRSCTRYEAAREYKRIRSERSRRRAHFQSSSVILLSVLIQMMRSVLNKTAAAVFGELRLSSPPEVPAPTTTHCNAPHSGLAARSTPTRYSLVTQRDALTAICGT